MDSQSHLNKAKLISDLFQVEATLGTQLAALKCRFIKSPARIRARLETMAQESLSSLYENLSAYSGALKLAKDSGVDPWDDTAFLTLTMRHLGLSFPNGFLDVLRPKHVVEAYDMHRRQIFRNLYFMEISNYSLLEVLSYDWPMLFHRDSDVTDIIIRQGEQDMWTMNRVIRAEVPIHYIRELLSEEPQICEVQQQFFAPLFSGPNSPGGGLVISSARPIGADKSVDRENLSFLN